MTGHLKTALLLNIIPYQEYLDSLLYYSPSWTTYLDSRLTSNASQGPSTSDSTVVQQRPGPQQTSATLRMAISSGPGLPSQKLGRVLYILKAEGLIGFLRALNSRNRPDAALRGRWSLCSGWVGTVGSLWQCQPSVPTWERQCPESRVEGCMHDISILM